MPQSLLKQIHTATEIPEPQVNERATVYAERMGQWFSSQSSLDQRKQLGQYFTPVEIADFMASLAAPRGGRIRIIDPGAGAGILACAICEYLSGQILKPSEILLDVFEVDAACCELLEHTLSYLRLWLGKKDISLFYVIHDNDFILRYAHLIQEESELFSFDENEIRYDICIANPPYFKLPKWDSRSQAASRIVHGQPNIYALFMAVSASLLSPGGQMIFITPRSFASGHYFRAFREYFFDTMRPHRVHIFASRKNAFKRDRVLQENIILEARRDVQKESDLSGIKVGLSHSEDSHDMDTAIVREIPLFHIVSYDTKEKRLHLPLTEKEQEIFERISSWTGSLSGYGLDVSTGPIVPFRAKEYIRNTGDLSSVPLLWLQHVRPMKIVWPLEGMRKEQYFRVNDKSMKLLVANKNLLLLRRFSAKEEPKRLVAAPYEQEIFDFEWLGIENHLNYIRRPKGALSREELWGLAIFYNSSFADTYFRLINGSTQVSATEIRSIPLPSLGKICDLGRKGLETSLEKLNVDSLVREICEMDDL